MTDPYSGEQVYVVSRLQPDWAVLHVQEADAEGNARILGSLFWDRVMSRAARGVLLTAERIVPTEELARQPELTVVPAFLVRAVVLAPRGAWPGSCTPYYDIDRDGVEQYLAVCGDSARLAAYLAEADGHLRSENYPPSPPSLKGRGKHAGGAAAAPTDSGRNAGAQTALAVSAGRRAADDLEGQRSSPSAEAEA